MAYTAHRQGFAHLAIVIVLAVGLAGSLGFIFWQNVVNKAPTTSTATSTQTSKADTTSGDSDTSTTTEEVVKNGTISGKAVYPSEGYPEDFTVCATTGGVDVVCDNSMAKAIGMRTYSLSVAPGDYQVVARAYTMEGYYDGYMKSGQTADLCKAENHTPLTVTVTSGAIITNIDAGDFYYMPENC